MSAAFRLPATFLATVNIHDRYSETGGWLLARQEAPDQVVVATGPGVGWEHARDSVTVTREGVDEAAAAAGLQLVGCWHSHGENPHGMTPSPDDHAAWRGELARSSPGLASWAGVIVLRAPGRTLDWSAWTTRRSGACEPVGLPPITARMRSVAQGLFFGMSRGPLREPPSEWQPDEVHRELARLDLELQLEERVQLQHLNAKLRRLGIAADLKPLPLVRHDSPAARGSSSDHAAAGDVIHGGGRDAGPGGIIRRPGIGRVLGVR